MENNTCLSFSCRSSLSDIVSIHLSEKSRDTLRAIGEVAARSHGRQRYFVLAVQINGFFDNYTKLLEDLLLVITVAAAENQSRRAAYIALVFFKLFSNFSVFNAVFHCCDSSDTRRTAHINQPTPENPWR
ncbi:MAG: hypothetical protein Q8L63_04470 [Alphaproteobacteria bacterium]|nr:hypothetical protein [Alphaproteobacteria bacterium]